MTGSSSIHGVLDGRSAEFAHAQRNPAGSSHFSARFDLIRRQDIDDGHARIGDLLFAFFRKIQHGLVGAGQGGTRDFVVVCFVGRVQADRNGIEDLRQFRHDVAFVLQGTEAVRIEAELQFRMDGADVAGRPFQQVQGTGGFPVAAEDKLAVPREVKGIDGRRIKIINEPFNE